MHNFALKFNLYYESRMKLRVTTKVALINTNRRVYHFAKWIGQMMSALEAAFRVKIFKFGSSKYNLVLVFSI